MYNKYLEYNSMLSKIQRNNETQRNSLLNEKKEILLLSQKQKVIILEEKEKMIIQRVDIQNIRWIIVFLKLKEQLLIV